MGGEVQSIDNFANFVGIMATIFLFGGIAIYGLAWWFDKER